MKKWEYYFYVAGPQTNGSIDWNGADLNTLGLLGWEAVGVVIDNRALLMKREIVDNRPESGV